MACRKTHAYLRKRNLARWVREDFGICDLIPWHRYFRLAHKSPWQESSGCTQIMQQEREWRNLYFFCSYSFVVLYCGLKMNWGVAKMNYGERSSSDLSR